MCVCLTALMGACRALPNGTPVTELRSFTVPAQSIQAISEIRVRWLVREDVTAYCQQLTKTPATAGQRPPLACAVWNTQTKECTIITGPTTNHTIMGHEVHHCFAGHFHPV